MHNGALVIQRQLTDAYPGVTQFQIELGNTLVEAGDVLRLLGRTTEARVCTQGESDP